jgi:hypothetical protein
MPTVEEMLRPYVEASTVEEAEEALDRLVAEWTSPDHVLGDCYEELAEDAANRKEHDAAVRLARKAIAAGCSDRRLARNMLAWYLLEAGQVDEGEEIFAALRREHPGDVELLIALGHARSSAGLQDASLDAFGEAVAAAKLGGHQKDLDRARIERRAEREHVGLPADDDDRLAPAPRPVVASQLEWALAWFPPDQREAALELWPALAEDFADPVAYSRRLEGHLRLLLRQTGQRPSVAVIDVDEFVAWSETQRLDPDSGEARSRFAAEQSRHGRTLPWPPARNDACWCRSGRKYKRCCGT